ncbi:uncharacterized protein LOC114936175 [Nylanderia fulva]|uniref:uncharacterized protein LOC114936175 n=1 Tax=Nylanderia fulva TaxID=613905 RepID=UPI0010FBA17F|nr:uncharacterized protein LOC114936175 [Nylanderia fulva]
MFCPSSFAKFTIDSDKEANVNKTSTSMEKPTGSTEMADITIQEEKQKEKELILYTNVRSLIKRIEKIKQIREETYPAVIALSETRVTDKIKNSKVNVQGYNMIKCVSENRRTGGVVLYVRDDIEYKKVLIKKKLSKCWCAAIKIKEKFYKGVIMVIYHSPSASDRDFVKFLEDIVEEVIFKEDCMVIGDFNIDFKMTNKIYTKQLKTAMHSLGMKQYIDSPTRITKKTQTIIDLVFANTKIHAQVDHTFNIADHAWLKINLNASKSKNKYREFSATDYSDFNIDELNTVLENKIGQIQGVDVSAEAKKFVDIVNVLDATAFRKKLKVPKVWEGKSFSDEIKDAVNRDETYKDTDQEKDKYYIG